MLSHLSRPNRQVHTRHRTSVSLLVVALGLIIAVFLIPFFHPLSIQYRDSILSLKGHIGASDPNAQGFRKTESTGPMRSRRWSLTVGGIMFSAGIFHSSRLGDYDGPTSLRLSPYVANERMTRLPAAR